MSRIEKAKELQRSRLYVLYDGRACGAQGTDDAIVFVACDSLAEAESYKGQFGQMACYSYSIGKGNELDDERWEWDYIDLEL